MDVDGPIINMYNHWLLCSPIPNPLHCFQAPHQPLDALLLPTEAVNETYNIMKITIFREGLTRVVAFIVHM